MGPPQICKGFMSLNRVETERKPRPTLRYAPPRRIVYFPFENIPTLYPAGTDSFDVDEDVNILKKAMYRLGTDEKALIDILTKRGWNQRIQIAEKYKSLCNNDLISDLKDETSGNFRNVIVALMTPMPDFLAKELQDAVIKPENNEEAVIEIICTLITYGMFDYVSTKQYAECMEKYLSSHSSEQFRSLLFSLSKAKLSEELEINPDHALEDAIILQKEGIQNWGSQQSHFNKILTSRSCLHLRETFLEFGKITGHSIIDAIKREVTGSVQKGLLGIVEFIISKHDFFAGVLHTSLENIDSNNRTLIRIVISRSEVDLGNIKEAYKTRYGKTLEDHIAENIFGDYKEAVISLIKT